MIPIRTHKKRLKNYRKPIYWLGMVIALGMVSISLATMMVTVIVMPLYEALERTLNHHPGEALKWYVRCSSLGWGLGTLMFFSFWCKIYESKKAK